MINPVSLFFSFTGRIGRRAYWFGLTILIALSPFSWQAIFTQDPFREAMTAIQTLGWTGVIWTLALFIPLAALNTKRLHDLGQTGLLAVLFYAPAALAAIELFVGQSPMLEQTVGPYMKAVSGYATLIAALAGAAGLWFLIRLGFYGGTDGPNKYGPEPGARTPKAAAA